MSLFALDTNTVAYFFQGRGNVGRRLLDAAPDEVALPAMVVYEVEVGLKKSRAGAARRAQWNDFVSSMRVLPFGRLEARAAASVRVALEGRGLPIGPMDVLIAGTAIAHQATLITHNTSELGRVPGLRVEDWF